MTRRGARGGALLWGMLASAVALGAVSWQASAIARQAAVARHVEVRRVLVELDRSALALARARLARDPRWTGPETLKLASGTVQVRVGCRSGRPVLELRLRPQLARADHELVSRAPAGARCP